MLIAVAGALGLYLIGYIFFYSSHFIEACEKGGDSSLIALGVEQAKSFAALTGPYSRFGFRHPGPFFFYLYALGEYLSPFVTPHSAHRTIQLIVNLFLIGYSGWHLPKRCGALSALVWCLLCPFLLRGLRPDLLETTWNPGPVVVPFLAALVLSAKLAQGKFTVLPAYLLVCSLALHNHVATSLPLLALTLGWLTLLVLKIDEVQELERWRLSHYFLLGFCVVINLPPVVEVLTSENWGNLGAFLRYRETTAGTNSLQEVLRFARRLFSPFGLVGLHTQWLAVLGIFFITVGGAVQAYRTPQRLESILWFLLSVTVVSVLFSAWLVSGKIFLYIFWFAVGPVVLAVWLLVDAFLAACLKQRLPDNSFWRAIPITSLLLLTLFSAGWPEMKQLGCGSRKEKFLPAIEEHPANLYAFVLHQPDLWMYAAQFVLELDRLGHQVCIRGTWSHVFGSYAVCPDSGEEDEYEGKVVEVHLFPMKGAVHTSSEVISLGKFRVVVKAR